MHTAVRVTLNSWGVSPRSLSILSTNPLSLGSGTPLTRPKSTTAESQPPGHPTDRDDMTSQHDGVQYSLCGALANQQGPLMTCPHLRGAGGLGVDVAVCLQGTGGAVCHRAPERRASRAVHRAAGSIRSADSMKVMRCRWSRQGCIISLVPHLRAVSDQPTDGGLVGQDVVPADPCRAGRRQDGAGQHVQRRGLARAVDPEEAEALCP